MDYNEIYGKYWIYNTRQWSNLGLKFDAGGTNINSDFMLECLTEDNNTLGYVMLFIQIMILKNELLNKNNTYINSGLRPELLYDRWTWKSTKISKYIRNVDGDIKANVIKHPYTHILNTYKMWMKQLVYEIYNKKGQYEQRSNDLYDKTVLLEPRQLNDWIDTCSEEWINQWVFIPDEGLDNGEGQETDKEIRL